MKNRLKILTLAIVVLGGAAVLGSYAWGIFFHPSRGAGLWGGVPDAWRPVYTANMLPAALGFLAFAAYLLFRVDPARDRFGTFGYGLVPLLTGLIVLPSAAWMPLTVRMGEAPSAGVWLAIRVVLIVVGLGSLGILAALLALRPRRRSLGYGLAVAGSIFLSLQTAFLDAVIWTATYPWP